MAKGGIHGEGGVCGKGGICGKGRVCVVKGDVVKGGMHGEGGTCMAKGGHAWYAHPLYEIRPVNARAVRILLECILFFILFREVRTLFLNSL